MPRSLPVPLSTFTYAEILGSSALWIRSQVRDPIERAVLLLRHDQLRDRVVDAVARGAAVEVAAVEVHPVAPARGIEQDRRLLGVDELDDQRAEPLRRRKIIGAAALLRGPRR